MQVLDEILSLNKRAKVIMLASINDRSELVEAVKRGALTYFIKPFERERLKSVLRKYTE